VPVVAIALQGLWAAVIAMSGQYEQILNYVVSVDFMFFGATALCVFVFRHRAKNSNAGFKVPGHPFTTAFFVIACFVVVVSTVNKAFLNSLIGYAILLAGLPVYLLWKVYHQNAVDKK
jgi:APA family basic amino acid/polyamine antiporter